MTWMTHWSIQYFSNNIIQKLTHKPNKPLPLIKNNSKNDHECNILCTVVLVTFCYKSDFYYYLIHLVIPSKVTFLFFLSYFVLPVLPFLLFQTSLPACVFPASFDCLPHPHGIHLPLIVIPPLTVCFSSSLCQSMFAPKVSNSPQVNILFLICYYGLFLLPYQHTLVHVNPLCLKPKLFLQTSVWSTSQSRITITHFNLAINSHTHSSHSESV